MNNPYKTLHILISARALGAAPVLNDEPPYDVLAEDGDIPLCDHDPASWERAIGRLLARPDERARARAAAERYCEAHYSGRHNAEVLDAILSENPAPGPLLRDARYRKAMSIQKTYAAALAQWRVLPVPVLRSISYRIKPAFASITEISTIIGSMGGSVAGLVRLEIRDAESGRVLRRSGVRIENLSQWAHYSFDFESLEAEDRELVLRFVPRTTGTIAVFETSNHCRSLWRRVLRKARLDLWGRDLYHRTL